MAFDVMVPLKTVLDDLTHDNDVRVVVLTGAGRGFSSGADHKSAGSVPHVDGLTARRSGCGRWKCSMTSSSGCASCTSP